MSPGDLDHKTAGPSAGWPESWPGIIPLTWLNGDDFRGETWFMRSVEFLRDARGAVTGLSVTVDDRSRDIRFSKVR